MTVVVERLSALGDGVTGQPHIHLGQVTEGYVLTGTIILIRNDNLPALLLSESGSSVSKQQSPHRNYNLPRLALS